MTEATTAPQTNNTAKTSASAPAAELAPIQDAATPGFLPGYGDPTHELLSPENVLQLQRTVGNTRTRRLVQRLRDQQPPKIARRTSERTVQRMIGFEAEYNILSLGKAPGEARGEIVDGPDDQEPSPKIDQFLYGGLQYGEDRGHNDHFTLKPDHNATRQKVMAIATKLQKMGYITEMPDVDPTNLEYVTSAKDELAPGSTKVFNDQIEAIKAHAELAFGASKTSPSALAAPAADTYTGVPEDELKAWLGADYSQIEPLVNTLKDTISDKFYLQATVGVIPSAFRDLALKYTPQSEEEAQNIYEIAAFTVNKIVNDLLEADEYKTHKYITDMRDGAQTGLLGFFGVSTTDPIRLETFEGVLHMIVMYLVGDALNRTSALGGTQKNAVPFMSKMKNMRDVVTLAAPKLAATPPPADLVDFIDKTLNDREETYKEYWIDNYGYKDMQGKSKARIAVVDTTFVKDILRGQPPEEDPITVTTSAATGTDRQFSKPDSTPLVVSLLSQGQQGAQFEYRYIQDRPAVAGLGAAFKKIIAEIREVNMKHLNPTMQEIVLGSADMGSEAPKVAEPPKEGEPKPV